MRNMKLIQIFQIVVIIVLSFMAIQCGSKNNSFDLVKRGDSTYKIIKTATEGNYELNLKIEKINAAQTARLFFSANEEMSEYAFLDVDPKGFRIGRKIGDNVQTWKTYERSGEAPWTIRVIKKGNFFRFFVNGENGWIRGPLGEWDNVFEPWQAFAGVEVEENTEISSFALTVLPWLSDIRKPVIPRGPEGSFYEEQAIPGAILDYEGKYYMYFMAGMKGNEEGSSRRTIGLATSKDLLNWEVHSEPIISYADYPYDNLYINGAAITPEGKIAVMFSAQVYPEWKGFMLATADSPYGPFTAYENNPAYKHFSHAHEFDLIEINHPKYRYMIFYSGFTTDPPTGPDGDRGYILYSNDLKSWEEHPQNPVFSPETLDDWDAVHIRPRSLTKIDDTWYVWYEGCNNWMPPKKHHGWWDTVGLARSKDLTNWEYYPRNPALPGLGISAKQYDNNWVGWPRMFVRDGVGYVFYTGGAQIGLRTISLDKLTNWTSEGGETIDLLK
jgi:predicted GH43/DUF377 family glycosyl hydrolase